MPEWNKRERRCCGKDRRRGRDRRALTERRHDFRPTSGQINKPLLFWIRSLTHPRLGVDRRKGRDRRIIFDDRRQASSSILSSEEIAALLGDE